MAYRLQFPIAEHRGQCGKHLGVRVEEYRICYQMLAYTFQGNPVLDEKSNFNCSFGDLPEVGCNRYFLLYPDRSTSNGDALHVLECASVMHYTEEGCGPVQRAQDMRR